MTEPKKVNLQTSRFPKMIGDLAHSNQFLKTFCITLLVLVFMLVGAVMLHLTKDPMVLTLGPDGKALERLILPKAEDQVKEAIKKYLEKRYQWKPDDVLKKLKESEEFILPTSMKAFQGAVSNVARFSTEKIVTQRIYPESIDINLSKKTALITGDRVTSVQGLKAAGDLKLELTFDYGSRTRANPWGVYISKEREE